MIKWLVWVGIGLVALGLAVLATLVAPAIRVPGTGEWQTGQAPTLLAVLTAATGLAGGFIAIGIGIGRWRRPRRMPDGSKEI
jgi:hypothetical protein